MNTLYPGLLGTFFIVFFGTFTCLILACAQISYGTNFPVNSIFMYFAVGLKQMFTSMSSDLVEFPH